MLLRVTEERGNLIEYVIARSVATWQSQPFHMRLPCPSGSQWQCKNLYYTCINECNLQK